MLQIIREAVEVIFVPLFGLYKQGKVMKIASVEGNPCKSKSLHPLLEVCCVHKHTIKVIAGNMAQHCGSRRCASAVFEVVSPAEGFSICKQMPFEPCLM